MSVTPSLTPEFERHIYLPEHAKTAPIRLDGAVFV